MERRTFLKVGSASAVAALTGWSGLLTWQSRASAAVITNTYYINDGFIEQPGGTNVYFRGFSDTASSLRVPARHILAQEDDTVEVSIENTLGTTHNFTIDGIVDSGPIPGGTKTTVSFKVKKAGTYFFHDNLNGPNNRLLGMHGLLAVMPKGIGNQLYAGSPTFVKQLFWVFNDIDPVWHSQLQNGINPSTTFKPRYFTINGLSSRPPRAPGHDDPAIDAMANPDTVLEGSVGDRTLVRIVNAGLATHSAHWHANHVEWLTQNGHVHDVWKKDVIPLKGNMGSADVIFPFEAPADALPHVTQGSYPMHLHDEPTQTAAGGYYLFGAMTEIVFK
jgi:hypothetical protein